MLFFLLLFLGDGHSETKKQSEMINTGLAPVTPMFESWLVREGAPRNREDFEKWLIAGKYSFKNYFEGFNLLFMLLNDVSASRTTIFKVYDELKTRSLLASLAMYKTHNHKTQFTETEKIEFLKNMLRLRKAGNAEDAKAYLSEANKEFLLRQLLDGFDIPLWEGDLETMRLFLDEIHEYALSDKSNNYLQASYFLRLGAYLSARGDYAGALSKAGFAYDLLDDLSDDQKAKILFRSFDVYFNAGSLREGLEQSKIYLKGSYRCSGGVREYIGEDDKDLASVLSLVNLIRYGLSAALTYGFSDYVTFFKEKKSCLLSESEWNSIIDVKEEGVIKLNALVESSKFNDANNLLLSLRDMVVARHHIRHPEVDFVYHLSKKAKAVNEYDWYVRWMTLAAKEYLKSYQKRLSKGWPIPADEKRFLSKFVVELVQIPEIEEGLRFKVFFLTQELQVAFGGWRNKGVQLTNDIDLKKLEKILKPHQMYLAYLSSESHTVAWYITHGKNAISVRNLGSNEIKNRTDSLLKTVYAGKYELNDPDGQFLSQNFLNDIIRRHPNIKDVYVTPSSEASTLPFSILPLTNNNDRVWAIERFSITHAPSIRYLSDISIELGTAESFFGIGAPNIGERDIEKLRLSFNSVRGKKVEKLRFAFLELDEARKNFSKFKVRTGKNATETNLMDINSFKPNVLSIATHTVQTKDIFGGNTSALLLNPDETSDGLLRLEEVQQLQLHNTSLVLLSACNTAVTNYGVDNEAFSGFGAEFIGAGAKNVLVTHWPVYDRAAKDVSVNLIKSREVSWARKLRDSILKLINSEDERKANPDYWGAFSLVGSN